MSKEIPLSGKRGQGLFAIVDDDSYEELSKYKWYLDKDGYVFRTYKENTNGSIISRFIFIHRQILKLSTGDKRVVDHFDHNKLDNRKECIRACSIKENSSNLRKQEGKTSQYKGVNINRHQMWEARICNRYLGVFSDEVLAAKCYDQAAREQHKEYKKLNFPDIDNYEDVDEYIQKYKSHTSPYIGVHKAKDCNRWLATISITKENKYVKIHIGSFISELEAAKAYDAAVIKYAAFIKSTRKLNFPINSK